MLPGDNALADGDVDAMLPHVCVSSCYGRTIEPVLDHDETAVATGKFGDRDDTVSSGEDRCPIRRCEVCTSVEGAFAGERVDTRAEVAVCIQVPSGRGNTTCEASAASMTVGGGSADAVVVVDAPLVRAARIVSATGS